MTQLRWGSATDVGVVRQNNEDQFLVDAPLFAVADGMGGHMDGEVASLTAVEALRAAFADGSTAEDLVGAVQQANRAVWAKAKDQPDNRRMGTTLTAVAVVEEDGEDRLALVNVGDSRTYLLRDGELQQLTDDHNVPGEMVKRGELTVEEAAVHPQKNIITRVMGVPGEIEVDVWQLVPYVGDRILLASDGLFDEVGDPDIAAVLRRVTDPDEAARQLVERARTNGGSDNITVVILDVVDDDGQAAATAARIADEPAPPPRTQVVPAVPSPASGDDDDEPAAETSSIPKKSRQVAVDVTPDRGRRVTWRVVLFVVALLVLVGGGIGSVWWSARNTYVVKIDDTGHVAIFKGRDEGLFAGQDLVRRDPLTLEDLTEAQRVELSDGHERDSRAAAEAYVSRVRLEAARVKALTTTTTTSSTTTTAVPAPPAPPSSAP
ncbi:MAG TPA: PP2C family serine/threonine-protein phosphatase [Acidimicrobiales bacterium]|nr:PP2C family serine/threonine-protein phosphatase [Acidimicrobiales bacterium]